MSTFVLLVITGLGLGALYFLAASGLSLIYGLMRVLNFAHGAFLTLSGYFGYQVAAQFAGSSRSWPVFLLAVLAGVVTGALSAALTELVLIRRLYRREIEQVLVTVGVGLAVVALVTGVWGSDTRAFPVPGWLAGTTDVMGAAVPNSRFACIIGAVAVFTGLTVLLARTRAGLVIRAGVENRDMTAALGIDVRRTFTAVFVLGGALAGLGGVLLGVYNAGVSPAGGDALLIFAFIVVVIGGLGSVPGAALAAAVVALLQQFVNYYWTAGVGDFTVVVALALVLLVRPQGLFARSVRMA